MKKAFLLALCSLLLPMSLTAQPTFTISIFNNAVALPGGSFTPPLHPGVDAAWIKPLKERKHSETFLTLNLGYYYQRIAFHGLQLYGEYNYRYNLTESLAAGISGGVGYLHTFELHDIFEQNAAGQYERTGRGGKMHAQFSAALHISYAFRRWPVRPFVSYRLRVMTPFVREYIPVLPSTSLHLGAYFTIHPHTQD